MKIGRVLHLRGVPNSLAHSLVFSLDASLLVVAQCNTVRFPSRQWPNCNSEGYNPFPLLITSLHGDAVI